MLLRWGEFDILLSPFVKKQGGFCLAGQQWEHSSAYNSIHGTASLDVARNDDDAKNDTEISCLPDVLHGNGDISCLDRDRLY
jgi:hypothetical protein